MLAFFARQYLRWVHHRSCTADADPRAAQERVHRRLGRALRGTRVADVQDARIWESLDRYRRYVRTTTYADHAALVDSAMRSEPCAGVFEHGPTTAFGHSSTSKKYVPFTRGHIGAFRGLQADVLAELVVGRGLSQVIASPSLVIQGSLEVERTHGVLSGYSSAVMVDRTPWLLKRRLLPTQADLQIPDLDARVERIGRVLLERRPRVLTGMPEFVVGVLRALLAGPDAARVRDALRGIDVYAWSGMALGPYRAFFDEHLAPGFRMFDVVSATEGAMGLQAERLGVYRPALARSLMLFADVDDPSDRRFAWELIAGREYDVLLGSFSGLQGYRVGDRVRVVSAKPLRFSLVPRGVDVGATWGLLGAGATDFCAYLDPSTRALRLLVEGKEPPALATIAALAARLGASDASVRLVDAGRIARAAVALTLRGVAKLPRIHSRPDLQAIVERCA